MSAVGFGFRTLPEGLSLGPLSRQVFDVLADHTSFPWPIMRAQCKRVGADPENIRSSDLRALSGHLAEAVGRFTSAESREAVLRNLNALAG